MMTLAQLEISKVLPRGKNGCCVPAAICFATGANFFDVEELINREQPSFRPDFKSQGGVRTDKLLKTERRLFDHLFTQWPTFSTPRRLADFLRMNPNIAEMVKSIIHGDITDDEVCALRDAVNARREINAAALRHTLKVGQSVWFKAGRPAYLNGVKAIVRKINRERVVVDLDRPTGRFFKGVRTPLTLLSITPVN